MSSSTPDLLFSKFLLDGWRPGPAEFYAAMGGIVRKDIKDQIKLLAKEAGVVFGYHYETETWRIAQHNQIDIAREMLVYGIEHAGEASKTSLWQMEAANGAGHVTDNLLEEYLHGSKVYMRYIERVLTELGYRAPR